MYDLLSSEDLSLHLAANAQQALELAVEVRPDVIVSDVMMPGIDGITLCRRLRELPETRATPIIIVTALDSRTDVVRALDAGATDFLTKPVQGVELRARVRSMLRVANEQRLLRQVLKLRADLTHMAVHDMRTPLLGIGLNLEIAARALTEPRALQAIHRIREGTARLQRLVDEMLIVAKSESGELTVERTEVPASELFDEALRNVHAVAAQAQARLTVRSPPNLVLLVDDALFLRCLENLLTNAVKFSPRGSEVEVEVVAELERVRIDVADQGRGVPAKHREAIFEPFRVGETHANVPQLGLGLAFCRMVMRAHGGSISVLPRTPTGSVFRLALPMDGDGASS